jgi:L-fuculose-phosphate aldolase
MSPRSPKRQGCLQTGRPPLLSSEEIERVRVKTAGYGLADV